MNNTVQNTKLDWTKHLDESTCEPMWFSDSRAEFSIIQKGDVLTLSFTDCYTNYPNSYFVKIQKPANIFSVNDLMLYAQNFYDKNILPAHLKFLEEIKKTEELIEACGGEEKLNRLLSLRSQAFIQKNITQEEEQERLILEEAFKILHSSETFS